MTVIRQVKHQIDNYVFKNISKFKTKRDFIKKTMAFIIVLSLIFMQVPSMSFAALSRPSASVIPLKSLIVGTYIVDFAAVSPTNIETAQKTIEDSGQDQMYYRSELTTGGLWINITNGSGVADILDTSESKVANTEIDRLILTHWIKNDGVVYEIGSGNAKSFSTLNPFVDPLVMDGMDPLKTERDKQVEILKNLDDDDDGYDQARNKKAILDGVLSALSAGNLQALDAKVDAIEASASALRKNSKVEDSAIHAVDDALKNATIDREIQYLEAEMGKLNNAGEKAGTLDYGTLSDMIWTAYGKLGEKVRELEAQSSGSAPATPLEAASQAAEEKLANAAASGNIDAIQAAAEEKALSDQLALGLPVKSDEAVALLASSLEDAKNTAIVSALKGMSFDYLTGQKTGEAPSVLASLLTEETEGVKEDLANWKDLVDMLVEATEDPVDQELVLAEYNENLTALMGMIPETDMKPKLLEEILGKIADAQSTLSEANADDDQVLQALLNDKDQKQAQLDLINEAYADALENGDVDGADAISDMADQLVNNNEAEAGAALESYFQAKENVDLAEKKVEDLLAGKDASESPEGSQSNQDTGGSGGTTETSGATGADGSTGTDENTGADETTGAEEVDMVQLAEAIAELGEARDALESAKTLLSPEDLQLIEAFLDLVDATILYADEGNGTLAVSSAQALEELVPTLPEGFDILSPLAEIIQALNTGKAEAALLGDISGAQDLAAAQGIMQETALGDFAQAQGEKDKSVVDVLSGTIIMKPDGFVSGPVTYVGIKSLFDQLGGQAIWNPDQQKALGLANTTTLEIVVGQASALVGDETVIMEANTLLVEGRAYLPFNTVSAYIDKFLDERYDGLRVIVLPNLTGE